MFILGKKKKKKMKKIIDKMNVERATGRKG